MILLILVRNAQRASIAIRQMIGPTNAAIVDGRDIAILWGRSILVEGLALMVIVKVPWEPELLDPWKAAWDRLIWKAMILKVKAIEGELNRNPRSFKAGRSQTADISNPDKRKHRGSLVIKNITNLQKNTMRLEEMFFSEMLIFPSIMLFFQKIHPSKS